MDTKSICPSCQKPLAPDVPMGLCPECLIKAGFPTGGDTKTGARSAFIPPTVEAIARLFPQLEVLELIGKGGMGAVYKARQKRLNRFVALKILPPGIGQEPAFAERFTREAQALARLNHPGIVTLYEFGETEGQFYFLMEFVDGVNLRQLLANSRVSTREALAIVPQICDALQFAHDQGIVHRDIKPENILLDRRGRVKVADFGLAKIIGSDGRAGSPLPAVGGLPTDGGAHGVTRPTGDLTDAGKVMGTPQYMSPEQIQAPGEVDNRADIYALGVVFYQMLTGELPGKRFVAPSSKVQIDVRLDEVVLRALEKNPALRYQQVSEVKTMVEMIAATPPGSSRGDEAQTKESEITPRFSRTAIVGAAWAAFAVIATIQLLVLRHIPMTELNASVWWRVFNLFGQPVLALTAIPGTTLLGWIAVAQIRRSAGELHGLWLAVFDGLVFPLLALGAAIYYLTTPWLGVLIRELNRNNPTASIGAEVELVRSIYFALIFSVFAGLSWFIIRRVWGVVNQGGAGVPPAVPARRSYPGKMMGIGFGGSVLLVLLLLLAFKVHRQLSTIDQITANPLGDAGARELNGPPFVARLNQAEVELVAVGNQPWTNPVCWLPNGALMSKPFPAADMDLGGSSGNQEMEKMAFRIHNESADKISYPVCRINAESGVLPQGSGWQPVDPRHPDDGYYQIIGCPTNAATMNVTLGVANGAWETAITLRHDHGLGNGLGGAESFASPTEGEWSATYNSVIGQNDVAINCNYTKSTNWASRMVGVSEDGKITLIPENSSSVSSLQAGGILLVSSNEFAHIKEFRLQRRKYQWAEFRNVSLQPGYATTVMVKETIEKPVATIQPLVQPTNVVPPFDTVVECVVTNAFSFATGGQSQVAWADGKRLELSNGASGMDKEKFLREHDIDLFTDDGRGLYGIDVKVTRAAWSPQISYEQIAGQLQSSNRYTLYGLSGVCFTTPGTTPAYWFETRTGLKGILQITGFTDNPRAVKIRYKLVHEGSEAFTNSLIEKVLAQRSARDEFQLRWLAADDDTHSPADILPANSGQPSLRVERDVILSSMDVESAGFSQYQGEQKELEVFLDPRGRDKFAQATAQNIHRQLAIVWRGRVICAPKIQSEIVGAHFGFPVKLADAEAQQLLDALNHRVSSLAPTNAPAVEPSAGQEIARLKLRQAELAVKDAELKFSVGTITEYELQKVKLSRDVAAAEVKGDAVEVARLKLAVADLDLDVVGKKVALGLAPQTEYDQAKLARDTAAVRYQQAQTADDASHR